MDLRNLTQYDWFKDQLDAEDIERLESNFQSSRLVREALALYIDHELDKLDSSLSLAKLKEIPDRAEYALMVAAQKEVLLNIKQLIVEKES